MPSAPTSSTTGPSTACPARSCSSARRGGGGAGHGRWRVAGLGGAQVGAAVLAEGHARRGCGCRSGGTPGCLPAPRVAPPSWPRRPPPGAGRSCCRRRCRGGSRCRSAGTGCSRPARWPARCARRRPWKRRQPLLRTPRPRLEAARQPRHVSVLPRRPCLCRDHSAAAASAAALLGSGRLFGGGSRRVCPPRARPRQRPGPANWRSRTRSPRPTTAARAARRTGSRACRARRSASGGSASIRAGSDAGHDSRSAAAG